MSCWDSFWAKDLFSGVNSLFTGVCSQGISLQNKATELFQEKNLSWLDIDQNQQFFSGVYIYIHTHIYIYIYIYLYLHMISLTTCSVYRDPSSGLSLYNNLSSLNIYQVIQYKNCHGTGWTSLVVIMRYQPNKHYLTPVAIGFFSRNQSTSNFSTKNQTSGKFGTHLFLPPLPPAQNWTKYHEAL